MPRIFTALLLLGAMVAVARFVHVDTDAFNLDNIFTRSTVHNLIIETIKYFSFLSRVYTKFIEVEKSNRNTIIAPNFADSFGGAAILAKSPEARSTTNILIGDDDKYMYMERNLPIYFVIGLKEEVAVSKILMKSREMYSSIVKHF